MKTEIKSKVQKLIENYKKVVNAFLEEIRRWEKNSFYTSDAKQNEIMKVKAQMAKTDAEFNQELLRIILEEKDAIVNATIRKPDDFQVQISNAIGFINLLGDKLTDEEAYELVKPFFGDFETMKRFHAVLSNRHGQDGLNVTCYSLGLLNRAAKQLEVFMKNFANFFNAGKYTVNSMAFTLRETAIITDAEVIEKIVEKLDSIILATYKEVEAELDQEILDDMGVVNNEISR